MKNKEYQKKTEKNIADIIKSSNFAKIFLDRKNM